MAPEGDITCEECKLEMYPLATPDWMIDEMIASTNALIEAIKSKAVTIPLQITSDKRGKR